MGERLMAIVAEGDRGRVYFAPTPDMEATARKAEPEWKPENELIGKCRDQLPLYGMNTFADIFTPRQLVALTTFSDLIQDAMEQVKRDATAAGLPDGDIPLCDGGNGATAYAEAVGIYLAFAVDKGANYWSTICAWHTGAEKLISTFGRQAIPMVWDYTETNPLSDSSGNFLLGVEQAAKMLDMLGTGSPGCSNQADANIQNESNSKIVSTDPPYYDNICYADLSDFFYVWLRRSLRSVFPDLFATLATPKADELVATRYRYNSKDEAEAFFLNGMTQAMRRLVEQTHPGFPVTIYYAFKQSERKFDGSTISTGWETFLDAVIRAGFGINGTWPVRTEYTGNLKKNMSALASSIVLVCRKRSANAPVISRREFLRELDAVLPEALDEMTRGSR